MACVLMFLLILVGCTTQPPPPKEVWRYPAGLTEAQAAADQAHCMQQTAYERDFVFRLVAIETCLRAKGWVKGPPSSTEVPARLPTHATQRSEPKPGPSPTIIQFYPPDWSADKAASERKECYNRTLNERDSELGTTLMVKCMQAKGFTLITAYYPSHLTHEQSEAERFECGQRGILDPDGLVAATVISCLRDKGLDIGPSVQ